MKITFPEVRRKQVLHLKCTSCGKRLQRTVTVMNTISPFNTNENGVPRSHSEVVACVTADLARHVRAVKEIGVECAACKKEQPICQ